ncbi:hypothetical protein [Flavobacterium akiainvivens]|nr:hypothetical protein [Flavobacterium akiainvivens]
MVNDTNREKIKDAFEISLTYPFLDVFIVREAKLNSALQSFLKSKELKLTHFTKELDIHLKTSEIKNASAKDILIQLFFVTQLPPSTFLQNEYLKLQDDRHPGFENHYRTFLRGFILDTLLKYQIF